MADAKKVGVRSVVKALAFEHSSRVKSACFSDSFPFLESLDKTFQNL
jgi:hypothetical protein